MKLILYVYFVNNIPLKKLIIWSFHWNGEKEMERTFIIDLFLLFFSSTLCHTLHFLKCLVQLQRRYVDVFFFLNLLWIRLVYIVIHDDTVVKLRLYRKRCHWTQSDCNNRKQPSVYYNHPFNSIQWDTIRAIFIFIVKTSINASLYMLDDNRKREIKSNGIFEVISQEKDTFFFLRDVHNL